MALTHSLKAIYMCTTFTPKWIWLNMGSAVPTQWLPAHLLDFFNSGLLQWYIYMILYEYELQYWILWAEYLQDTYSSHVCCDALLVVEHDQWLSNLPYCTCFFFRQVNTGCSTWWLFRLQTKWWWGRRGWRGGSCSSSSAYFEHEHLAWKLPTGFALYW